MHFISRWTDRLSLWGEWVGIFAMIVMVAVTFADVLGAKLFLLPVPGAIEVVSLAQVVTIVFAVAATQRRGGHISVEMFVNSFPMRLRALIKMVTTFLCLVVFGLLVYEGIHMGNEYLRAGEVSATAQIPFYPFAYAFSIALFPMVLLLLIDLVKATKEALF